MKKALTLLLAATLSGLASAVTIEWSDYNWTKMALPGSTTITSTTFSNAGNAVKTWSAAKDAGVYIGQKGGGGITNWGQTTTGVGTEGTWTNTDNTGSAAVAYRNGVSGDFVGIVLSGMDASVPTDALNYTFSVNNVTAATSRGTGEVYVGIVRNGNIIWENDEQTYTVTAGQNLEKVDVSLDLSSVFGEGESWQTGDKIFFAILGISNVGTSPTAVYTIDDITLSLGEVIPSDPTPTPPIDDGTPEPTVLSLLAIGVAGLALRRKMA